MLDVFGVAEKRWFAVPAPAQAAPLENAPSSKESVA